LKRVLGFANRARYTNFTVFTIINGESSQAAFLRPRQKISLRLIIIIVPNRRAFDYSNPAENAMSGPSQPNIFPITNRDQLIDDLASGCKTTDKFRIGTEHEKFVFHHDNHQPAAYEPIKALLTGLQQEFYWLPIHEGNNIIALKKDGAAISLEPGGQFELSGAPLATLHDTRIETQTHLNQVKIIGERLGLGFLAMGFAPDWSRDDIPWMPKGRYAIMKKHMPRRGKLGLDMMLRTCTVQVNLDFSSEADMVKKLRLSLALQPLATALFANSPFTDGKPNGFSSYRGHIWSDTDPDRTGNIPFAFDPGFGFEQYVDYLLDVPMYFVYRDGQYLDASGLSFRDFLTGNLAILPGEVPTLADWQDHQTTAFPDVRLKKYLEMRGADVGPLRWLCALPAFWTGLFYDTHALNEASNMIRDWTSEDRDQLRRDVPRQGLKTIFRGRLLLEWALEFVSLSRGGLTRRNQRDPWGEDESQYLDVLFETIASGQSPSDRLLNDYKNVWNDDIGLIYRERCF